MPLVNTIEMLKEANRHHYAVGCFNVDSLAMVQAVLCAAEASRSPVILSFSAGSREFMHPGNLKALIETVAQDITIPYAIHLDHGKSFEICRACIDEGFTSVMIDGSAHSFEENVAITKDVCAYAHARGVAVEGELGGLDAIDKNDGSHFTNPEQAKEFVLRTGVDSLAVSAGTGHGTQKFRPGEIPSLRLDILKAIKELLPDFPLVFHGSSSVPNDLVAQFNRYGGQLQGAVGIPEELLKEAIAINVSKINIGTDFRLAYVGALRKSLAEIVDRYEPRHFLAPARTAAQKLVSDKINRVFMSANRVETNKSNH
ncbi:MAG: ketose-bisphosphate aldolase [Bacilli bacterium]|jgi:fructose-bisphosphate aldolase class II